MLLQYPVRLSRRGKAARSLGCVWRWRRRPCLALNRQLVLHSRPLIYGGRIKRHGLYRSAVAFLYSHRHSWGTAGWSGKRFTAPDPCGVLKTLASAAATSSSFPPSPRSPLPPPTKTRGRRERPANPAHLLERSISLVQGSSGSFHSRQRGHH